MEQPLQLDVITYPHCPPGMAYIVPRGLFRGVFDAEPPEIDPDTVAAVTISLPQE